MRKAKTRFFLLSLSLAGVLSLTGCFTFQHTVGRGSVTGEQVVEKQWYALYGLVPTGGESDSSWLAGGATDYTVTTEFTLMDVLISAITSWGTFYRQTVVVTK